MEIKFVNDSGDALWFEVDGQYWGVGNDDDDWYICDFEGYPQSEEFYLLGDNQELIEGLKAAHDKYWEEARK